MEVGDDREPPDDHDPMVSKDVVTSSAAAANEGHSLVLNDQSLTIVEATRVQLDATYVLTVNHRRPDASTKVQGRLIWVIDQRSDGLWELSDWIDQELAGAATWSDLKAEFVK